MAPKFFYILILALMFHHNETGFVLQKGVLYQIHTKGADGRRIIFVKGNCDSNKFFSLELKTCVKALQL